jgi:hypothetical protein
MYSPKIDEALIPPLYRLALARRQPMTTLVSQILARYLATQASSPAGAGAAPAAPRSRPRPGLAPHAAGEAR